MFLSFLAVVLLGTVLYKCLNSGSQLLGSVPTGGRGPCGHLGLNCFPWSSMLLGRAQHLPALGGNWPHSCSYVRVQPGAVLTEQEFSPWGGTGPCPPSSLPGAGEGAALTQPNPGGLGQFSLLQLASERGPLPSSIWAGQPGRGPAGWLCVPAPAECGWKESRGLGVPEILQAGCRQRPDGPELWVQKQLVKPARPLLAPALEGWAHLGEGGLCSQSMHTCWQVHRGRATQAQD